MENLVVHDIDLKGGVQQVAEITEKVLRVLIFNLLEEMIQEESADGDFVLSSIPSSILNELRLTKKHFLECKLNEGNDWDKYILRQVVCAIQKQLEYTAKHYHQTFHKLILDLDLSCEFSFAYDTFVNVCKKFFQQEITWYRIISLLAFGAEIALFVIKQGGPGVESFLRKIVHYVIEFVAKEEIGEWITNHGGWMAMIDTFDNPDCPDRGNHILTVMTLTEITHVDVWMERIMLAVMFTGVCYTVARFICNRKV